MPTGLQEPKKGGFEMSLATDLETCPPPPPLKCIYIEIRRKQIIYRDLKLKILLSAATFPCYPKTISRQLERWVVLVSLVANMMFWYLFHDLLISH